MKYLIVIPDGVADEPVASLGGKTPLEAAATPALDSLARRGIVGRANHTPAGFPAGSDVANLSLFGYEPARFHTGRAPIEAAAQSLPVGDGDWVLRCNLVTIVNQTMESFTAGQISSEDARELLAGLQELCAPVWPASFHPGVSYRNLVIWHGAGNAPPPFSPDTRTVPPHDLTGQAVSEAFPRGPGSHLLCELMDQCAEWLAGHPVNRRRTAAGQLPATHCWLWGQGQKPHLEAFASRHGLRGAMITAVDLLRGLARLIGWDVIEVAGATGYTDTDYGAKGRAAVAAFDRYDMVCVHVEATDEASHEGDAPAKVAALEAIDREIIGPAVSALEQRGEPWRILVSPDHPTLLRTRTHSHGDVPFVVSGNRPLAGENGAAARMTEALARQSRLQFPEGWRLMEWFVSGRAGEGLPRTGPA